MTTNEESVPTTDAQFDAMLTSAVFGDGEEDDPEDPTEALAEETEEEDDEPTSNDPIATGEPEESDDVSPAIADVVSLIEKGATEAAKQRLGEYSKGLEKLQQQRAEAMQVVSNVEAMYEGLAQGDERAIQDLQMVLGHLGTSIEDLFAKATGIDPDTILEFAPDAKVSKPSAAPSKEFEALRKEIEALKAGNEAQKWASTFGPTIAQAVEQKTGMKFDIATLQEARQYMPQRASVEDIVKAVMKANPEAYLKAFNAVSKPVPAPKEASVSRGGKSAPKLDANAILKDPRLFEAHISK